MFSSPEADFNQIYLYLLYRYFHKVHTLRITAI